MIFLNELIDDNLISPYDTITFLEKYILEVNFDEYNIKKYNKIKLFRNIREKWIEKCIEEIGIVNNKKYLLDFIKEKNYTDEEIEILLNIFKFKGNDDNIQLISFLNSFQEYKVSDFIIYLPVFFDGETESYNDLNKKLKYFAIYMILNNNKVKDTSKYINFLNLGQNLLLIGWSISQIEELFDKKINFQNIIENEFNEICDIIVENKIAYSTVNKNLENLIDIFCNYPQKEWDFQVKNLLVCNNKPFDFSSLIEEISKLNQEIYSKNEIDEFASIIIKIKKKKNENLPETNKLIKDTEINDIKNYFSSSYFEKYIQKSKNSHQSYVDFMVEVIAIINRGTKIFTQGEQGLNEGYELRDVQLLAIVIILLTPKNKGIFAQIKTGQGKSIIVAVLAVFKALYVKYVDILTSSIELAHRDSLELKNFYEIFNLTVSSAKDEYPYTKNILYSDTRGIEGDILREKFYEEGKRMKNKNRGYRCLIIDEVDSICVDRLSDSTLLTFHPKGFAVLQNLYPYINYMYNIIMYGIINDYYGDPSKIKFKYSFAREKLEKGLKLFLDSNKIRIPNHLKYFVENQIKKYAISIGNALYDYEKDVGYKIIDDIVRIVDNQNTGVVYENMVWTDGLHQFIEIKHAIPLTTETMTTTFLCHYNFYMLYNNNQDNNYETNIIGVTGTIGSEATVKLLKKLFNVNIVKIPPFCPSKFIRLTNKYGFDTFEQWRKAIVDETIENTSKNRPVLIITNSGNELSNLNNLLKKQYNNNMIYTYEVNERDELKKSYSNGEILIGKNLAGRGTDLKLIESVEHFGGLHVIVTFLPINIRVEEQAFGRTARKGLSGTGRLIIKAYKSKSILEEERNKKEKKRLKFIEDNVIDNLKLKEDIFNKVCKMVINLKHEGYKKYVIDDLQEQWGLFFKFNLEESFIEMSKEKREQIKISYNQLEKKLLNNARNQIFTNPLNCLESLNYENALKYDETLCFYFYQYKANYDSINKIDNLNKFIELARNYIIPELYFIGTISNIINKRIFFIKI